MIGFYEFFNIHKKEILDYFFKNNLDINKAKTLSPGCGMKDNPKNNIFNQQFYDLSYMPKRDKSISCIDGDSPRAKTVLTIWYINKELIFEQNELTIKYLGK